MNRVLIILIISLGFLLACDKSDSEPEVIKSEIRKGSSQIEDNQFLSDLYLEILSLSTSYACSDELDWKYTAIGAKACGGPAAYIAYSTKLDVGAFLAKVSFYTHQQEAYNIKWGITSDCSIPPEPKGVSCEEGQAILQY